MFKIGLNLTFVLTFNAVWFHCTNTTFETWDKVFRYSVGVVLTLPILWLIDFVIERGFSASKTGIASEAIIKAYGGKDGNG